MIILIGTKVCFKLGFKSNQILNFILSSIEVFVDFSMTIDKIGFPENSLILPKKRTKTPVSWIKNSSFRE